MPKLQRIVLTGTGLLIITLCLAVEVVALQPSQGVTIPIQMVLPAASPSVSQETALLRLNDTSFAAPYAAGKAVESELLQNHDLARMAGQVVITPIPTVDATSLAGNIDIDLQVINSIEETGTARVVVNLLDPVSIQTISAEYTAAITQIQTSILAQLSALDFQPIRAYQPSHVPVLVGTINASALAVLQSNPAVISVQIDGEVHADLGQSVPAIGANTVHNNSTTGQGVTVAVLDTGIDTNHPDLSDDLIAQHCFAYAATCPPSGTNEGTSAEDEHGHGTHVSGIITSGGVVAPEGFAPDAQIVAVRVLDQNGSGSFSDVVYALDWIINNQGTLGVDVINMSLGGGLYSGACDTAYPSLTNVVNQLVNNYGVVIFAASSNDGSTNQISLPACISNVVAVGATYDSNIGAGPYFPGAGNCHDAVTALNVISCYSNGGSETAIVAPGGPITSSWVGGGSMIEYGTSMASPTAAGVAALMLQANPNLTPAQVRQILVDTGTTVIDAKNGLSFPRIDALAAVQTLLTPTGLWATPTSFTEIDLTWTDQSANETDFRIERAENGGGWTQIDTVPANTTSYTDTPITCGTRYSYRVRAYRGGNVLSNYSNTASATSACSPLNAAPQRNYFTTNTPALSWNRVTGAETYEIQIATAANFAAPLAFTTTVPATTLTMITPSLPNGTYYWHVRALNSSATGAWSATESFVIASR